MFIYVSACKLLAKTMTADTQEGDMNRSFSFNKVCSGYGTIEESDRLRN